MKRVQFKDLPEKVQGFLLREFFKQNGKYVLATDVIRLDWLHPLPLWSLATDDERLAYAEWRYKIGVRLKDAYDDEEYDLKLRDTIFYLEKDPMSPHDILLTRHEHHTDITIYDSDKNKWAEIIEEPFNLTDTGDFRSEPEFKAGEIVDVWNTDTEMDLQPAKYRFFADGKHWVETCASDIVVNFKNIRKPSALTKAKQALHDHIQCNPEKVKQDLDIMRDLSNEFKAGDEVQYCFDEPNSWGSGIYIGKHGELFVVWTGLRYVSTTAIRKPDPDKELKEIAKEILKEWDLLKGEDDLCDPDVYSAIMEMGKRIEALKKGKSL